MAVRVKTTDPFWWALFSAGGTLAAFLVPVHVLVTGVALAFGWVSTDIISYERMQLLLESPWVRIYLFVLIAAPFFHFAHRFRYILMDLGLRHVPAPVAVLCYGAAIVGTILAAVDLFIYL